METTDIRSNASSNMERRTITLEAPTLTESSTGRQVYGLGAVFNKESRLIPRATGSSFIEVILPGFFDAAERAQWPGQQGAGTLCLLNHSVNHLLGSTRAVPPTLSLAIEPRGLAYTADAPSCRTDVIEMLDRREIVNSSITFAQAIDTWRFHNGIAHRDLHSGELWDIGPVSGCAGYADTTAALRSLAHSKDIPEADVLDLVARDELQRLFTRSDRSPQPAGKAVWEIQQEHMTRILDLWARRIQWDNQ